MPYISADAVRALTETVEFQTPGDLNYAMSCTAALYLQEHGLSYKTLNDISGAFTEALAEFRRRIVVPYEELKRETGVDPYADVCPERKK